ncbi:MAG: hypothetical protein B7Y51_11085 [Burkholderiales bacterium 28-67-8]|nr:MAG: hypothetical protein B7Y51_11085 [Burkholderiales bacterium 28-67-8]
MKRILALSALCLALGAQAQTALPTSQAKKDLVSKILVLQQPDVEMLAKNLAQEPAGRMLQEAGRVLQSQVAEDNRDAVARSLEASARKYVDEAVPLVRERAIKLAPSTIGTSLEERFTEEELRGLIAWLESPTFKKYQQVAPEIQRNFMQKLVSDARPVIEPKLKALEESVRATLMSTSSGTPPAAAAPAGKTPAKAASK